MLYMCIMQRQSFYSCFIGISYEWMTLAVSDVIHCFVLTNALLLPLRTVSNRPSRKLQCTHKNRCSLYLVYSVPLSLPLSLPSLTLSCLTACGVPAWVCNINLDISTWQADCWPMLCVYIHVCTLSLLSSSDTITMHLDCGCPQPIQQVLSLLQQINCTSTTNKEEQVVTSLSLVTCTSLITAQYSHINNSAKTQSVNVLGDCIN